MSTKNSLILFSLLSLSLLHASEKEEITNAYISEDFISSNSDEDIYEIPLFKSPDLEQVRLLYQKSEKDFFVYNEKEQDIQKVNEWLVNKDVRRISINNLNNMLKKGYLSVHKLENGEYKVEAHGRLKGGGVLGAWLGAWIAGGLVAGIGHGTIGLIALCAGPAGVVVGGTLEFWFGASITSAAYAAAVGGGILGGVASGPV